MTVNEAASRWNVNVKTVVEYIVKGYIFDLTIENNRLILPDISKPKIIKGNYKKNSSNYYKWILEACRDEHYINSEIIGIDEELFDSHVMQLVKEGFLIKNSANRTGTNIGYQITSCGIESLNSKKNINIPITVNFNFNVNTNIGAGNTILTK